MTKSKIIEFEVGTIMTINTRAVKLMH